MPVGKRALRVGIDQGRLVPDGQPVGSEAPRQGRFPGTAFRGGKGDDAEHAGPSKVAISRKPKLYNFDVQQHSAEKRSVRPPSVGAVAMLHLRADTRATRF